MKRYTDETKRLYATLESELSDGREWLVGGQFTLADLAQFPWVAGAAWAGERAGLPCAIACKILGLMICSGSCLMLLQLGGPLKRSTRANVTRLTGLRGYDDPQASMSA